MIRWLVHILLVTVLDRIKVYRVPHPVHVSYLPRKTTEKEGKIEYSWLITRRENGKGTK